MRVSRRSALINWELLCAATNAESLLIGEGMVEEAAAMHAEIDLYMRSNGRELLQPASAQLAWITPLIAAALVTA